MLHPSTTCQEHEIHLPRDLHVTDCERCRAPSVLPSREMQPRPSLPLHNLSIDAHPHMDSHLFPLFEVTMRIDPSPLHLLSLQDVWYNVDVASPLIAEASRKADELLQSSVVRVVP